MSLDMGRMLTGTFASEAFPTAGQGTIASDVDAQVNGTTYNSVPTVGGGNGTTMTGNSNARQPAASKNILYTSAGIVIAALILLWLLGGIVFRIK